MGYRQKRDTVEKKSREANRNLEKVQNSFDLWNYRTIPCLTIMGKIHKALAGKEESQRLQWLKEANHQMGLLDEKLGKIPGLAPQPDRLEGAVADETSESSEALLRGKVA